MQGKFSTRLDVRYQDTDSNLRMTPIALLGAMQEAAVLHAEAVGQGVAWHAARARVWMVVQTWARIARLPTWRTQVTVTTWATEMGRLLSKREFLVEDEAGELVRASTLWAFLDTQARQVTRVPAEVASAYPLVAERLLGRGLPRPRPCPHPERELPMLARRRDLDSNGHVNNLRHLEWMLDCLPELPPEAAIRELNIRYQREILPGARALVRLARLAPQPGAGPRFCHEIADAVSGERLSTAETTWSE
ncbi:MAG TPA: thioesterase [Myxococcota bacterium]|nr:thioesterase [Myxococcota bacterium]HRY95785.1 thioesterase [Myxococcota bacterium]HSA23665.1 thioesterase [Myxococcota bacterium]